MGFPCPIGNPLASLVPCFVESEKTGFSATFDELIGLCDEFCGRNPRWELRIGGDGVGSGVPSDLSHLWRRIHEIRRYGTRALERGSTRQPVGEQELCVVFADGWVDVCGCEARTEDNGAQH